MKAFRKSDGSYIEVGDLTPVSPALVRVALRPGVQYTWGDNWQTDPMNVSVCWQVKTNAQLNQERDGELQAYLDSVGGKVAKAIVATLVAKGVATVAEIRTEYRKL